MNIPAAPAHVIPAHAADSAVAVPLQLLQAMLLL
jgi:hypothetical protein